MVRLFLVVCAIFAPGVSFADELNCFVERKTICGPSGCELAAPLPGERIIVSVAERTYRLCDNTNGCQKLELDAAYPSGIFWVYEFNGINVLKAQTQEVADNLDLKPLARWPFMEFRHSFLSAILSWGECSPN